MQLGTIPTWLPCHVTHLEQERRVLGVRAQKWDLGQECANGNTEPLLRLPAFFQQSRKKSIDLHIFQPVLRRNQRIKGVSQKLKELNSN